MALPPYASGLKSLIVDAVTAETEGALTDLVTDATTQADRASLQSFLGNEQFADETELEAYTNALLQVGDSTITRDGGVYVLTDLDPLTWVREDDSDGKKAEDAAAAAAAVQASLNIETNVVRSVAGKTAMFSRSSNAYGLGDAIAFDGIHYAQYSIRALGGATFSRNANDLFWEFDPRLTQFDRVLFSSGAQIDATSLKYFDGQEVRSAETGLDGVTMAAATLADGSKYIHKLRVGTLLVGSSSTEGPDGIIYPLRYLVPVGDSLTAAGYADVVSQTLDVPLLTPSSVSNTGASGTAGGGIGSQTANQIAARFGAFGLTCTVASNTLSAGPNTLTAISLALLSRASDAAGSIRTLRATIRTVAGAAIKGMLMCVQQSGGEITFASQPYRYTFTPDDEQTLGAVPATAVLHIDDERRCDAVPMIWVGRNNVGQAGWRDEVKLRIAQKVAAYRPLVKRMVIIGVTNSTAEFIGASAPNETNYNDIVAFNADLAVLYPDFFCDVRPALNAGTANDTPNPAFMADATHYNGSSGRALVGSVVASFIRSKGWF